MKKSTYTLVATALVAAMALAGCSQGSSSTTADGKVKLTYMFRGGTDERAAYNTAIKQFEKDHNVKVDVIVTAADQYATKLKAAITGRKVPDVFYVDPGDVAAYVKSGVLRDITKDVQSSTVVKLDNIWKYGVDSYRFDGTKMGQGPLYALPKDVGPFSFGYNKSLFQKAGIPLPDKDKPYTWPEFTDVAKKLTKDVNGDGKLDQWGTGLNVQWNLQSLVWSNGGDWLSEDQNKVTVDTVEFAEALQFFADLQNVHKVTPAIAESQTMDTYQRWMRGQIGFFPVGPWDVSTYAKLPFDWDLIPYPAGQTGKSATWIGSLGIGVSKNTPHPDLAVKLATYLSADKSTQQGLVKAGIQIPNLMDMAKNEYVKDTTTKPVNKQEFLQVVLEYGRGLPTNKTYNAEWYNELFTNIQPVLDGKVTAAAYVKKEQPLMQAFLDKAIQQSKMAGSGN